MFVRKMTGTFKINNYEFDTLTKEDIRNVNDILDKRNKKTSSKK